MNPLNALRAAILSSDDDDSEEKTKIPLFGEIEVLRDALTALNTKHNLRPGMIVRQKKACPLYKTWSDNEVAIVVEMLPLPIISERGDGSAHYREPQDMIIGERLQDGKFALFHVDSRHLEPVPDDD